LSRALTIVRPISNVHDVLGSYIEGAEGVWALFCADLLVNWEVKLVHAQAFGGVERFTMRSCRRSRYGGW
jgi:hypothetical protein